MKRKLILTIVLAAAAALSMQALKPGDLFNEFKGYDDVEHVKIPKFLFKLAMKSGDVGDIPFAGKMNGLEVLEMSDAKENIKERFDRRLTDATRDYDKLINVKENGTKVRIFTKKENEKYRDLYIYVKDSTDCVFTKFSGTFTADDLREMVNNDK